MNAKPAGFIFQDGLSEVTEGGDFVARVPGGITTREQLFEALHRELNLPSYFGGNWDALSDCLRDLSWIASRRVIIVHEAVPAMDTRTLKAYLDVLAECVNDWKPGEEHELVVIFPERAKVEICGLVKQSSAEP